MSILFYENRSHKKFFICNKADRLHLVHSFSILIAFKHQNILIAPNTRVCGDHLEQNCLIKEDEFNKINTHPKEIQKSIVDLFNIFSF